jgi:hypothetical protein
VSLSEPASSREHERAQSDNMVFPGTVIASIGAWSKLYTQIAMAELLAQVADKIDRAVQRVTPLAYRMQRKGRRWMRRAMRKPRSVSEGPNLLPLLIQVLASFSNADGFLRH